MQGKVSDIERRSPVGVIGHGELSKAHAGLGVSALRPGVNLSGIFCSSDEIESLPTLGYRQLYPRLAHLEQLGLDSSH
jgi:hypothetical protein